MNICRRLAALLLTLLLLPVVPARAAESYSDVPENHWAYESICRATELGLIGGVGGGKFGFGQEVTRAQYATMLCRLMGWTMLSPDKGSFDDNQNKNAWYYSAIETAYANGAILKLGQNCRPGEAIAREEMAAMTVRALGFAQLAGVVQDDCHFADVTTNPGYIALAYHMGFMSGVSETNFQPKASSRREQAAAVLLRVYDRMHAAVKTGTGSSGVRAEAIDDLSGRIPMCPRAPLENVYDAAIKAGKGGAVVLRTAPCAVEVKNGKALPALTLTEKELADYLESDGATTSRSARYASSYLVHTVSANDKVYVWYESAEDIALKVELCRLLGVAAVYTE